MTTTSNPSPAELDPGNRYSKPVTAACWAIDGGASALGIEPRELLAIVCSRFGCNLDTSPHDELEAAAAELGIELEPPAGSTAKIMRQLDEERILPAPLERPSLRTMALGLADAAGTLSTLHDKLESLLITFADHVTDRDAETAELRDEILALSHRIEGVSRTVTSRTDHLA